MSIFFLIMFFNVYMLIDPNIFRYFVKEHKKK